MSANTKILILLFLFVLFGGLLYTLFTIGAIIAIFLLAMLFAFILAPAVDFCESIGVPRGLGAALVFLTFFGGIGIALYIVTPFVYAEITSIQEIISIGQLRRGIRAVETFFSRNLAFLGVRRLQIAPAVESGMTSLFSNILNIASGLVGLILFVVMMLISTFFLLKDGRGIKKALIALVPNRFFEMALSILHKIDWSLGAYLRGILLDAFVIGCVTTFAMWMIDLPNYVLVGVVAGFANLVPYLGPPTAALVASFISVVTTTEFEQVPLILFVFVVIRLFDDSIVQPLTISQSVQQHPLIIIFAILIGGQLFGIIGMLFAVPVFGVLKVVLSEFYYGVQRFRPVNE